MSKTLTNEEYDYLVYQRAVLAKLWSIATEGEDRDYDTNNFYDLVREGAEARKKLAEGKRQIEDFIASRTEEASVEFDVTLKAVSDSVESCAKIAEAYDDRVCCDGSCGGNIAAEIGGR